MTLLPADICIKFPRTILALTLSSAFCGAASAQQTETAPGNPINRVVVTGQGASMSKAITAQNDANSIVSVVSADEIGGLPDKNAAEALARVSGVSVQRDQGEGRYVVVRGLGPTLNAITVNGALLPSPEGGSGTRAVSLDVVPVGLIGQIEVYKTLTPDMDANSLGGTVEIKTLSAFDLKDNHFNLNLLGSYDENTGKTSPSAGALVAKRFLDGKLGIAAALSMENRKFGSDNVETGGAWTAQNRLTGFELRDYYPERDRNAFGLNMDFRPRVGESYYLRSIISSFSDDEIRDRLTIGTFSGAGVVGGSIAEGQSATARAERRLRDRKYTRELSSLILGTEQSWDQWKLALSGGISTGKENTPDQLNDARFRQNGVVGVGFTNTEIPTLFGPANLYNPASYTLNSVTFQRRNSKDEEKHLKTDLTRRIEFGEATTDIKAGLKLSRRDKTNDTEQWTVNTTGAPNMASFVTGERDYQLGRIGPGLDPALIRAWAAGRATTRAVAASTSADFNVSEDVNAAYVQASTDIGRWNVLAGVRNERTDYRANGYQVSAANVVTPISRSNSYSNLLPALHLRYDLAKDLSLRGAWTNSVVRANFDQIAPGVTYSSATEATIGNPDLKPLKSANLDFGVEYMLGKDGALSVYAFSKDIQDFTYTTNLAGTPGTPWATFTTATSFANGDEAKVNGIEIAYQHALRHLPAPWNGLLLGANATLSGSKARVARFVAGSGMQSREIRMPGQSNEVFNLIVGYEKGPISTRLALNQKSPYLLGLGNDILNAQLDQYVDTQKQLDFTFKYQVTKNVQAVFEAINLNNEKYYVYQGSKPYNVQYEEYGRTFKLGLNIGL